MGLIPMAGVVKQNGHRITRPVLRYFGGKYRIGPWIVAHLPPHRVYVEPFGGAASVLLRKPRSYAEVYNDLDGEVVNVFRVLQDAASAAELERRIRLTPYARAEFELAYQDTDEPIEKARRTIIKAFMGFGSNAIHVAGPRGRGFNMRVSTEPRPQPIPGMGNAGFKIGTGFRVGSNRSGTTPAHDWRHYADALATFTDRLQGVAIENRDAIDVVQRFDRADTLTYVDPPYVHATRANARRDRYRHEMTDDQHRELAQVLHACRGMVVLSGFASPLYEELYGSWHVESRPARGDKARRITEVLWFNERAAAALAPTLWSA